MTAKDRQKRRLHTRNGHGHIITHFFCFIRPHTRPFMLSLSARLNTSLTPEPVLAEHSMYLAPISLAIAAPCSGVTVVWPCAPSILRVLSSRRRSVLVPTSNRGVFSQKCDTSGYHCNIHISASQTQVVVANAPCLAHSPGSLGNQWRKQLESRLILDSSMAADGRTPPVQPCPIMRVLSLSPRIESVSRSFQTPLGCMLQGIGSPRIQ